VGCAQPVGALVAGLILLVALWIARGVQQARRSPTGSGRN
jgi:hypothetical protein